MSSDSIPIIGQKALFLFGDACLKGKQVKFSPDFYYKKYLIILFYPHDFPLICPTELLMLNEHKTAFESENALIVCISTDSISAHLKWAEMTVETGGIGKLDFYLLSDITGSITNNFNSQNKSGSRMGMPLRSTFILDTNGILRFMSFSDQQVGRNVDDLLRNLRAISQISICQEQCPSKWKTKGDPTLKEDLDSQETVYYFENVHGK